ncbi:MAG: malto-oligosyltrehalose synthase [Actinobacteria bacterium]|nr:malto-oligosyltrehalose synthase [Actinomycetota bacterium]
MANPTPDSTYRFQLTPQVGFAELRGCAGYLEELGVTTAYLSPILQAVPGSQHGYDVIDHSRISADLGGEPEFIDAAAKLAERGIGIVVDVVPNHVALPTPESLNPALWSVLRYGPDSEYARWFDIDPSDGQPILLPILGARIDEVIDADELVVDAAGGPGGEPILRYYDHELPIRVGTASLSIEELLSAAYYRLAYWHIAGEELNYRRFFDVDTLVAIRVEDPEVFTRTHEVLLRLMADGTVTGLRIDHPDGLADPEGYLASLAATADQPWVVVEKILAPAEKLSPSWECVGTTGYDAAATLTALFCDPDGAGVMQGAFAEITGEFADWPEVAFAAKKEVLSTILFSELQRLASLAHSACQTNVRWKDYSLKGLTEGLTEFLAHMEVYRAYVRPGHPIPLVSSEQLSAASHAACATLPQRSAEIDLLKAMASGELGRSEVIDDFVIRFQQTSGPVLAKGVEDTASYRWFPLASLCDVGAEPDVFGVELDTFHRWCLERKGAMPGTMNALSTHDTKRSEDVRARINVFSEVPEKWLDWIQDWQYLAGSFEYSEPVAPGEPPAPMIRDARTEWLLWQTMVGTWPIDRQRMGAYLIKAVREAKLFTSWVEPNGPYEAALSDYLDAVYDNATLMESFRLATAYLTRGFVANSLGQRALQLFMPGIPDTYQGCETVSLTLVDPDNRRPLDPSELGVILDRSRAETLDPYADHEAAKMRLSTEGLHLRQRHPDAVGPAGTYVPLKASGEAAPHVVGFMRGDLVIALAVRHTMKLESAALEATTIGLPHGDWFNILTKRVITGGPGALPLSEILGGWPVAILESVDPLA